MGKIGSGRVTIAAAARRNYMDLKISFLVCLELNLLPSEELLYLSFTVAPNIAHVSFLLKKIGLK